MDKKISFGFSKLAKKPNLIVNQTPEVKKKDIQLIEYLEEQSIKVVGAEEQKPAAPLVIPMKQPNKKLVNLTNIVENNFNVDDDVKSEIKENAAEKTNDVTKQLSLEELAVKELLRDLNENAAKVTEKKVIDVGAEKVNFEGEKESTLEDYENIPIGEFGKAVLRGMGWQDGAGIGKNQQVVKVTQPPVRPKGMGLGADKMAKQNDVKSATDKDGKPLACVKGAYVKVNAGCHKGNYGQIIGLDDESGRFIIKLALQNINVSLNEFLVTPVTKDDYGKNSKVLNNAKYDEYIKTSERRERSLSRRRDSDDHRRERHKSKKSKRKKDKKRYSDDSDDEHHRRSESKKHHKKRS